MPHGWLRFALIAVCTLACEPEATLPGEAPVDVQQSALGRAAAGRLLRMPERVPDQYIVVLKEDADVDAVASGLAGAHGGRVGQVFRHALRGYVLHAPEPVALRVAADPRVKYVEEDAVVRAFDLQSYPPSWGLDRVDQRALPLDYALVSGGNGSCVNAYIIDSGIRITHAQFGGRAVHA